MAYIWINPVADSMYDKDTLDDFLYRHGYQRIEVSGDWIAVVKEKYQSAIEQTEDTVLDMRCPKIRTLLETIGEIDKTTIPDIKPILIHCGQEASEREELKGEEKIITTPCQALADMGNELGLKDTRFISWNGFLKEIGSEPEGILPRKSPIPPGFFEGLDLRTDSVTGEEEIRRFFENNQHKDLQLVELLYCKEGCHNGDGIIGCKKSCHNEDGIIGCKAGDDYRHGSVEGKGSVESR